MGMSDAVPAGGPLGDQSPPDPLDTAMQLHDQGRWLEAERLYITLLGAPGPRYDVLLQLALLRAQQGQQETAIALLRKAIAEDPDTPDAYSQLGEVLVALERHDEALDACAQSLAIDPDDPATHYNRGAALQARERQAEAVVAYREAIRLEPCFPAAHYNLGAALQATGQLGDALDAYRQATALKPDYARAHARLAAVHALRGEHAAAADGFARALAAEPTNLEAMLGAAGALRQLERYDEAVALLESADATRPDDPRPMIALGDISMQLGRHDAAAAQYSLALDRRPGNLPALLGRAAACMKCDRQDEAIACLEQAAAAQPDDAWMHVRLAEAKRAAGRGAEAIPHFEQAVALKPDSAEILNNLGNALTALHRHDDAVVRYRQALSITPDNATLHHNLATTLETMNRPQEALAQYRHVLALDPAFVDAKLGLAVVLRELGHLDAAQAAFEAVIQAAPGKIAAYHGLSMSKRFTVDDPHLAALEAFAAAPASLSDDDRMYLEFALSKAYDDLGEHERAVQHLIDGNRMKRRQFVYDEAMVLGIMERSRAVFSPGLLRRKSGHGNPSRVPVFIIGMMRSGSTLVEQILASHSEVFAGGEIPHFETAIIEELRQYGPAPYPDAVRSLNGAWVDGLAARYLRSLTAEAPAAQRVTDKLLGNFNYLGLIHLALPQAKIIHTMRDPLDTCLSCFSKLFSDGVAMAFDLEELGRYYRHYARLMAHWRAVLPPGVMLEVRYEDVVQDLAGQARRIVAHCGLDWDDACLAFHRTERPVRTASVVQVRQPIYASSVGRARKLRALLGPLIEALGEAATADA
jgi:tetratricopeptide (TPR) repeat protein